MAVDRIGPLSISSAGLPSKTVTSYPSSNNPKANTIPACPAPTIAIFLMGPLLSEIVLRLVPSLSLRRFNDPADRKFLNASIETSADADQGEAGGAAGWRGGAGGGRAFAHRSERRVKSSLPSQEP